MKLLLAFIFLVPVQNFVYAQSDSIIVHQLAKDATATQLNYLGELKEKEKFLLLL